jgi:ferredoxin
MTATTDELAGITRQLLADGTVSCVIAYGRAASGPKARPVFLMDPADTDGLVWDPTCVHGLPRYVVDEKRRRMCEPTADARPIGVVVKGCDSRSIVVLLQEHFVERQDVYLIGVSCEQTGMIDERRLAVAAGGARVRDVAFDGADSFLVTTDDGPRAVPASELLADRCRECTAPSPRVFDVLVGGTAERNVPQPFGSVEEFGRLSREDRWAFWEREFDKCIRCYACRSVCPMCYCDECVADSIKFAVKADTTADEKAQKIKWVEKSPVTSENAFFHLVRALHLAGRCTDCAECERSCPVNIPLRLLNKEMEREAKALFDYDVGVDPNAPALVACFREDDPGDFIR